MWVLAYISVLSGSFFVGIEPAGLCVVVNLYLEALQLRNWLGN